MPDLKSYQTLYIESTKVFCMTIAQRTLLDAIYLEISISWFHTTPKDTLCDLDALIAHTILSSAPFPAVFLGLSFLINLH